MALLVQYLFSRSYEIMPVFIGCLLSILLFSAPANAGLFSTLSKITKATKHSDVDIPLNKLDFPDHVKDFTPATIKLDANGEWNIAQLDGSIIHIDDLINTSSSSSSKTALVMRATDLPKDMRKFDRLPNDWPVFIQGKAGRFFELKRGGSPSLIYNNVFLRVKDMDDVRDALWMLQRPSMTRAVRFFKLDKKTNSKLNSDSVVSDFSVESATVDGLIEMMGSIKHQALGLSGRLVNGELHGIGKNPLAISMEKLQMLASENDLHLVILDSDRPDLVLKKISRSMHQAVKAKQLQFDNMGDFFNRLIDTDGIKKLELNTSRSGENQIAIQWQAAKSVETNTLAKEALIHLPSHVLLHSVLSHIPDKERSRELDLRIIPNVSSDIQFYVIVSVVLGFTSLGTSWKLWRKIWPLKKRKEHRHLVVFLLLWPIHRLLFLLLFLPTLGLFSFLWLLLLIIYKVFDWTLIRPSRWLYRLLT